jgi:Ubiquitin carboxyl-terminal hydrolase
MRVSAVVMDLKTYIAKKEKLEQCLKGTKATSLGKFNGRPGLANQGATCYLNSLIQVLFHDLNFRKMVLEGSSDSDISVALRRLFSRMMLSVNASLPTNELSTAFGWSRSQVFEQHDAHELFGLLLDAIAEASPKEGVQAQSLYRGTLNGQLVTSLPHHHNQRIHFAHSPHICHPFVLIFNDPIDYLVCPSCSNKKENSSPFLNVSLDISDKGTDGSDGQSESSVPTAGCRSLSELLKRHMQSEVLDADNKWQCDSCKESVQAVKSHQYSAVPSSLMVHLKRITYNTVSLALFSSGIPAECSVVR